MGDTGWTFNFSKTLKTISPKPSQENSKICPTTPQLFKNLCFVRTKALFSRAHLCAATCLEQYSRIATAGDTPATQTHKNIYLDSSKTTQQKWYLLQQNIIVSQLLFNFQTHLFENVVSLSALLGPGPLFITGVRPRPQKNVKNQNSMLQPIRIILQNGNRFVKRYNT